MVSIYILSNQWKNKLKEVEKTQYLFVFQILFKCILSKDFVEILDVCTAFVLHFSNMFGKMREWGDVSFFRKIQTIFVYFFFESRTLPLHFLISLFQICMSNIQFLFIYSFSPLLLWFFVFFFKIWEIKIESIKFDSVVCLTISWMYKKIHVSKIVLKNSSIVWNCL